MTVTKRITNSSNFLYPRVFHEIITNADAWNEMKPNTWITKKNNDSSLERIQANQRQAKKFNPAPPPFFDAYGWKRSVHSCLE